MQLMELQESLTNKLKEDYKGIETDSEYYYITGQCIRYMASKYANMFNRSITDNKVVKFILQSKDNEQLRKNLKVMLLNKCGNILDMEKDKNFNYAFAMLMGYMIDSKNINRDYLEIGYNSNNIL
jgi:hypothetical protein